MSELNDLIGKAKQELDSESSKAPPPDAKSGMSLKGPFSVVLLLIAVTLLAQHFFAGHLTPKMIETDLGTLTQRAQQSIDDYYRENKQLPPYIPDPSLRAIVRYQVLDALSSPPKFELESTLNGVKVKRNSGEAGV